MGRRERLLVIYDILKAANEKDVFGERRGATRTRIMYKANLSFNQLKIYLPLLIQLGLLEEAKNGRNVRYRPTEEGIRFLNYMEPVREFFIEFIKAERAYKLKNKSS
ncbi:MAG TPA: hypothetical protein ENF38_01240 [Candidatus Aenigmarchaeota archaeon]|nr:hypothetical protein [Candidatus Aenigmarchaeota archaeon]